MNAPVSRFHAFHFLSIACLLSVLLLAPATLRAEQPVPSLSSLEQQINEFVNGPDYRFAPDSTARARAMLAASTMAERRKDTQSRDQGALETLEALNSARRLARDFKDKYSEQLKLETAAIEAAGGIPDSGLATAQAALSDLVRAFEQGQLNESAAYAKSAKDQFIAVIKDKLPAILNRTDAALLAASRSGAKRYAPVTYGYARQWLADALAFNDGLNPKWPEHPRLGLTLAARAQELSKKIKQWRKKPESYEILVLKARDERMAAADALGMKMKAGDPTADIDAGQIVEAIRKLKAEAQRQQQQYNQKITMLEAQYQLKLAEQSEALRNDMSEQQSAQLSEMKEAFRAKLERETFETRRQKKLGELFKKDEVEILANVDGSLLLRLSALQFASGSTRVNKKYYDLLGRVRTGLDLYPDRKIVIEGHTDNRGEPDVNQRLSLRRAETVRDFLIAAGMDGARLKSLGYGEVRPVASNDYDRGRAMNRRIDIIIQAAK